MPDDQRDKLELELKTYAAIEALHAKLDGYAANVRKYADEMLAVKDRQNRHGSKIRRLESVVYHGAEPPPHATAPAWRPPPMRSPMASKDWDPEDTSPHMLAPEDMVRLRDVVARDRKESNFWRELPRAAIVRGFGIAAGVVITVSLTAAITWLVSHH